MNKHIYRLKLVGYVKCIDNSYYSSLTLNKIYPKYTSLKIFSASNNCIIIKDDDNRHISLRKSRFIEINYIKYKFKHILNTLNNSFN